MDPRMYPTGNVTIDANVVVTTPTLTDKIVTYRGDSLHKAITLANLLQNIDQLKFSPDNYTAAGTITPTSNFVTITNATPSTPIAMTLAAPIAGMPLIISQASLGTSTVTLATGRFIDAATPATTHTTLTFNAADETLIAIGVSATAFIVLENIGAVDLSTA